MPTISVYIKEKVYWRVAQVAMQENMTIPRTVALILESYFEAQEKRRYVDEKEKL